MRWKKFLELHVDLTPYEKIARILLTRPDVYEKAEEEYPDVVITDEIANEVLYRMDRKSDCEFGMTWDTLEYYLKVVLKEHGLISE